MNRRAIALLPAALIVIVAAANLAGLATNFGRQQPAEADWTDAAAQIVKQSSPDEAVWVNPAWDETALPALLPVGQQLRRQRELLAEDLEDTTALWVLTPTQRSAQALERLNISPLRAASTQRWEHGEVTLLKLTWSKGATTYPYALRQHLNEARVEHIKTTKGKEQLTPCGPWDERQQRWRCPGQPGDLSPARSTRELGDHVHDCIWAPPPGDNKTLRITFPQVPLQKTLRFRAGLTLRAARFVGTDVQWRVYIGQQRLLEETLPQKQTSWEARALDTSKWSGQRQDVRIEVFTKKQDKRFFCFNAWVMPHLASPQREPEQP